MNKKAKVITASVVALTAVGTGVAYIIHKLRKADGFTLPDDYKPSDDDLYNEDDPFGYDTDPFAESRNCDSDTLAEGCRVMDAKSDKLHDELGISICYKNGAVPTFDVCSQDLGKSITPKADSELDDIWEEDEESDSDCEDDDWVEDEDDYDDIEDDTDYEEYETDEDLYAEESSLETDVDVSDDETADSDVDSADKTDDETANKSNHSDKDFSEFTDNYEM